MHRNTTTLYIFPIQYIPVFWMKYEFQLYRIYAYFIQCVPYSVCHRVR